jgi:hypothetical protein
MPSPNAPRDPFDPTPNDNNNNEAIVPPRVTPVPPTPRSLGATVMNLPRLIASATHEVITGPSEDPFDGIEGVAPVPTSDLPGDIPPVTGSRLMTKEDLGIDPKLGIPALFMPSSRPTLGFAAFDSAPAQQEQQPKRTIFVPFPAIPEETSLSFDVPPLPDYELTPSVPAKVKLPMLTRVKQALARFFRRVYFFLEF